MIERTWTAPSTSSGTVEGTPGHQTVVDPHRSHFAVRKLLHFRNDAPAILRPRLGLKAVGIVYSYNIRLRQLPPRSVLHECFTVSPKPAMCPC
jgi:hypothetical protein